MQTFGEDDKESTPTKPDSQTKNLVRSLTLQNEPESIEGDAINDLDHEFGKQNDKTNVIPIQEEENSPKEHTKGKKALIEVSDVDSDDVDY